MQHKHTSLAAQNLVTHHHGHPLLGHTLVALHHKAQINLGWRQLTGLISTLLLLLLLIWRHLQQQ